MHAGGFDAHGTVGDEDQLSAIADALTEFDADLILLRLHAPGSESENWRAHRLASQVRAHFNLQTTAFYFDPEGHVVGSQPLSTRSSTIVPTVSRNDVDAGRP